MLNCKPGQLAMVVRPLPGNVVDRLIVRVNPYWLLGRTFKLTDLIGFERGIGQLWGFEGEVPTFVRDWGRLRVRLRQLSLPDCCLMPIEPLHEPGSVPRETELGIGAKQ